MSHNVAIAGQVTGLKTRFLIGGGVILVAVAALILSGTLMHAQYFLTVEELLSRPELIGRNVRISGAVVGDTIEFSDDPLEFRFEIAHVPDSGDEIATVGGLAEALHLAVSDPDNPRLLVVVRDQPMPDLLQDEAQVILEGHLAEDGIFYADTILLKCPTRYAEELPGQVE